ncbi:MAG TPA: ROK family protein [Candidatus Brocadiia bacterium]|nr:ROK family protein [Candidatus Brocadiia bacterium]
MSKKAIGIDLGGTNIKSGVMDSSGNVLAKMSSPTPPGRGVDEVVDAICKAMEDISHKAGIGMREVAGVGIGAPGAMDLTQGIIHISPNFPGWIEVPFLEKLKRKISIECVLENDANAAALGEAWAGAGKGAHSVALLTLGTGVGGGVVFKGKPFHGFTDVGPELGHMILDYNGRLCGCGNKGCLEAYASATAMVLRMKESIQLGRDSILKNKLETLTAKDIYDAAVAGDAAAKENMEMTGVYLGIGITSILHAFNPEIMLLAGGVTAAGEMLLEPIRRTVMSRGMKASWDRTAIRIAALGGDAGLIGAAGCLFEKLGISA